MGENGEQVGVKLSWDGEYTFEHLDCRRLALRLRVFQRDGADDAVDESKEDDSGGAVKVREMVPACNVVAPGTLHPTHVHTPVRTLVIPLPSEHLLPMAIQTRQLLGETELDFGHFDPEAEIWETRLNSDGRKHDVKPLVATAETPLVVNTPLLDKCGAMPASWGEAGHADVSFSLVAMSRHQYQELQNKLQEKQRELLREAIQDFVEQVGQSDAVPLDKTRASRAFPPTLLPFACSWILTGQASL